MNPAYSSQTCSACGFVANANRRSQSTFFCRACGHAIHADVNAARNPGRGDVPPSIGKRYTKAESLRLTVQRHLERLTTRDRVIPDTVLRRPYYRGLAAAANVLLTRTPPPQYVVADVSAG